MPFIFLGSSCPEGDFEEKREGGCGRRRQRRGGANPTFIYADEKGKKGLGFVDDDSALYLGCCVDVLDRGRIEGLKPEVTPGEVEVPSTASYARLCLFSHSSLWHERINK